MLMTESRTELLAWLSELSHLSVTKIESCGSGAAHCVVMDSIYRDVPLHKVKFAAKHEYEYVANFKILQASFDKHHIDNAIPVERLIKSKFQDNLEFLQWMKKFWDQYYPGGTYPALERRKGESVSRGSLQVGPKKTKASNGSMDEISKTPKKVLTVGRAAQAAGPEQRELMGEYQKMSSDMTQQIMELKLTVDQVEKEREFYFSKLREIEIMIQNQIDNGVSGDVEHAYKEVQSIMYKTEDGFELPEVGEDEHQQIAQPIKV